MLKHEDHIFTNLNGYNSFELKDAISRGSWSDTKKTLVLWGLGIIDIPVLSFILIAPNI